jgi:hypothetical protein
MESMQTDGEQPPGTIGVGNGGNMAQRQQQAADAE